MPDAIPERLVRQRALTPGETGPTRGAIVGAGGCGRRGGASAPGRTARASASVESASVEDPGRPEAAVRTPSTARPDAETDRETRTQEWFGPVSRAIGTDSTECGPRAFPAAGGHAPENRTRGGSVNRSATSSDVHGSAADPAAGATPSAPAFVPGRRTTLRSRLRPRPPHHASVPPAGHLRGARTCLTRST
ncbi:aldehyde dehydrogenase family protein [Streptomyces pseudovenezuelae]|uniref:hypothetical protein n=1 Tax=Streptomyces pseudovenezuelae TaxID=67350 RepID=UPI002E800A15|nr:hypothetical protein [Streptomyces pseudovenezuelae]WUA88380.1 hypothetical protein OHO81_14190 [Streptomyces pseudovenezuelae]